MSRYGIDEANFYNYDIVDDRDFVIDKYFMNDFSDVDDPNFLGATSQVKQPVKRQAMPFIKKTAHPLLVSHAQMGFSFSDLTDAASNLYNQGKQAVQQAISANEQKLMQAGTAQLTNIVGSALTKLSATSPQAQQAISQVVGVATKSAQQTVLESIQEKVKQYKLPLMIGGGALVALIAYSLYRKK